jgi:hypothetical protein
MRTASSKLEGVSDRKEAVLGTSLFMFDDEATSEIEFLAQRTLRYIERVLRQPKRLNLQCWWLLKICSFLNR